MFSSSLSGIRLKLIFATQERTNAVKAGIKANILINPKGIKAIKRAPNYFAFGRKALYLHRYLRHTKLEVKSAKLKVLNNSAFLTLNF